MNLHPYLLSLKEHEREKLAALCKTTQGYLFKLARNFHKGMRAHPTLASLLERYTDQKVRRWELNPEDWFITWPEMVGCDGVPPLPVLNSQALPPASDAANDPNTGDATTGRLAAS